MNTYTDALSSVIETEEFVSPEDYLLLRKGGKLGKRKVRMVSANLETGDTGGFMIELETPRYKPPNALNKEGFSQYAR